MSVSNSRIKRFLACALAVVMIVMCWFPTYAKAVVLEGAALLTLDLFINVLIIAMLGSEMDGAFRGAAAADDMKPKDWLSLQINKYTNGQGLSEPGFLNMFQAGVKYWQDGTVVIGEEFAGWITDFQNWLWGNTDLVNTPDIQQYAETVTTDIWTNGDFSFVELNLSSSAVNSNNENFRYASVYNPGSTSFYLASSVANTAYAYQYKSGNRYYICVAYNAIGNSGWGFISNNVYYTTMANRGNMAWVRNLHSLAQPYDGIPINNTSVTGTLVLENYQNNSGKKGDPDKIANALLGVAVGATAAGVAIGLPDSVLVGRDGETLPADATVDIADYVSAVADAAAGVYYPTMPVAIPGEGVVDVPVSIPADTTVPVDGVDDVGVDEATGEAAGDVAGEASGDVTGTGDYTVALSDFFPFCIPFDLLAMLKKFQASAEAPKVDVPFNIQGNVTVFTVDLSPWDPVARVLRTMEKIAFAIGLAWATKNLIQGGS